MLDLTDEERTALIGLLRRAIDEARYPYSRRYNPIKTILAKLDPLPPQPELTPRLPAGGGPRVGRGRQWAEPILRWSGQPERNC